VAQPHARQHGARQVGRLRFRQPLGHHRRQHHVASHRQVRKQVELLEDHAHLEPQGAQPQFVIAQLCVGHHDGAAVDLFQPVHAAQQRALARAALADDGDHLARLYAQRHPFQDFVVAELLADVFKGDEGHATSFPAKG